MMLIPHKSERGTKSRVLVRIRRGHNPLSSLLFLLWCRSYQPTTADIDGSRDVEIYGPTVYTAAAFYLGLKLLYTVVRSSTDMW